MITWQLKLKLTLLTLIVLSFVYAMNTGTVRYEASGVIEQESVSLAAPDPTSGIPLEFVPVINSQAGVFSFLSVRSAGDGYLIYPSGSPLSLRNVADDYNFSGFDQLAILAKSECGSRETSYISRADAAPLEHEFVRLFWSCDNRCEAVVSEIVRPAKSGIPNMGRHVKIEMPGKLCQTLWDQSSVPQQKDHP